MSLARITWEVVTGADARLTLKWWTDNTKTALMPLAGYGFSLALYPLGVTSGTPTKELTTANGGMEVSEVAGGTPSATVAALLTFKIEGEDDALPVGVYEGKLFLTSGSESIPQMTVQVTSIA